LYFVCFNLYCGCFNLFCNVWVCVCVGVLVICVLVFTVFLYCLYSVFCIVSFMYIYSHSFCLYKCKDYCHRVTTQLQLVVVVVVVVVVGGGVVVVLVVVIIRHFSPHRILS
jgi:hypothetical protein